MEVSWDKAYCNMCFEVQMIRLKVTALHYTLHNLGFTSNVLAILANLLESLDEWTDAVDCSSGVM